MLSGLRPYLILSLLCLGVFLPGLGVIPPLDRDEARFAQATRQVLESGNAFDLRFQDDPRYKKPHGIYWLQAAAVSGVNAIAGDPPGPPAIWPHRLPSVLGAWAAVLLTFAVGARLFDRRTALLGAAILAVSVLLILEAHQAKTDAVLLATVVAAQFALARIWLTGAEAGGRIPEPPGASWLVFWLALAAGVLIKGPITPMIPALTIAALVIVDRRWRWLGGLQPLRGLAVFLGIVVPWAAATWIATDGAFFAAALGGDLAPKLAGGHESHGAPPGYHLLLLFPLLWPGSLLLLPAVARTWRDRRAAVIRFCLAWIVPAWIVFEAVPTKLPHYVLPLYPPIALLIAAAILAPEDALDRARLRGRLARVSAVIWAIIGVTLAVAAIAAPIAVGDGFSAWSLLPAAAALAAVGLALRWMWRGRPLPATLAGLGFGAIAIAATLHLVLPRLSALGVSPAVAEAVRRIDPAGGRPVVIAGYAEPSVVFLLGTGTRLAAGGAEAAEAFASDLEMIAVIDAAEWPAFTKALPEAPPEPAARISGLNYSKGRPLALRVLTRPAE